MKRRNFLGQILTTSATIGVAPHLLGQTGLSQSAISSFNLNYAPHIGMFRNLAGEDPIDQLHFMADQGFLAFEDNDMKNRTVEMQDKMTKTMSDRNMAMGVFVAHKIYWNKPNLASGDEDLRQEFLTQIKESKQPTKGEDQEEGRRKRRREAMRVRPAHKGARPCRPKDLHFCHHQTSSSSSKWMQPQNGRSRGSEGKALRGDHC